MDSIDVFIEKFTNAVDFQNPLPISADTVMESLPEWDSLAALGVIVMFDMEYGKRITGEDLHKIATVKDLYQLIN